MPASKSEHKPNIVYILADDMGYGDVSCLNPQSRIQTRHIDDLAADGMTFTDAHASSAVSTPSRYSLLTGRYNWRSWLKQGVTWGYSPPLIEPKRLTLASLLKQEGYATACVGKWHLGLGWRRTGPREENVDLAAPLAAGPAAAGFDYFFGISASLDMPPYIYIENDRATALPDRVVAPSEGKAFWRAGPIAPNFAHAEVLPTLVEKAVAYIEQRKRDGAPFLLYLPLPAPHTPILPASHLRGTSGTNAYGDFCLQVDEVVGQVMAAIGAGGLAEQTIFIFASDNGCSPMADFAELAQVGHHPSHTFRGHKADIYEGGHRVPLIVRWPEIIKPGTMSEETVCLIDLMATCADILGRPLPETAGEDSLSNLPIWRGQRMDTALREATVHHSYDGSFSMRAGRWKLELCPGSGGWSYPRPGEECRDLPPIQLYDLQADIGEQHNVFAEHPDIIEHLTALLSQYVRAGRSTPGEPQQNWAGVGWEQLWWMVGR